MIQYYYELPVSQVSTIDIIGLITALASAVAAIIMIVNIYIQYRARLICFIEAVSGDSKYEYFDLVIQNIGVYTAKNIKLYIEAPNYGIHIGKIEDINKGRYPKFLCKEKCMRIRIRTEKDKNLPINVKISYNNRKMEVYKLNTNEADLTKVSDLDKAFGLNQ